MPQLFKKLLAKKFSKKRTQLKRPIRFAKKPKRKKTLGASFPVPRLNAKVQAKPQEPAQITSPHPSSLMTADFIHPSEALQSSLQGFILDQRSEHTQRAYGKDIKRFVKFLLVRKAQKGSESIDRMLIIAYKDWLLNEKLEHTTIDRHLATLRSVFGWLMEDGFFAKNPAEKVRFLNPKRISKTNGFTDEEVARLLKLPDLHTRVGAQHYAILMVLFYCGLRRSELCALRTHNLGTERGHRIFRLRGKGNAERVIVLTTPVWNALRYYFFITGRNPGQEAYVFSPMRNNRTGTLQKPLDPSMIFYIVTKYARLAGVVNKVSPHSCRATAISNARDHQVSDRAIQEFAGWASPDMITRYDKRKTSVENSAAHSIDYGTDSEERIPEWIKNKETRDLEISNENPKSPETLPSEVASS